MDNFNPLSELTPAMKQRRTEEVHQAQGHTAERAVNGYTQETVINTAVNMYTGKIRNRIFSILATGIIRERGGKS